MIIKIYNKIFVFLIEVKFYFLEKLLYFFNKKKLPALLQIDDPLISIICPTFNRSKMLETRSIPSVLSQSYKNFELLIICDGCTDNSIEVIKKFNDNRIKVFEIQRNKKRYPPTVENHWFAGPVMANNEGLKNATGDWIARIDDDDIWTSNHLEDLIKYAKHTHSDFVSSSYLLKKNGEEKIIDVKNDVPRIGGVQTWLYAGYLKFAKYNINCWRKSWNKVNDIDLQYRLYNCGVKMSFLEKVTCIIEPRPNEKETGIKAYKESKEVYKKKYEFK